MKYNHKIEDTGKQKVLFIHGFAASDSSINAIKKLKRNFDIISINLPFNLEGTSINKYIDYVNGFVSEIGLTSFSVIGHSLGGAIAMGVERANKRILIAPLNPFSEPNDFLLDPKDIETAKRAITDLVHEPSWTQEQVELMAKHHIGFIKRNKENLNHLIYKEILNIEYLETELGKHYKTKDFTIIQGSEDKYISVESVLKCKEHFGAEVKIIEKCGHSPISEKPEETLRLIDKALV